MPLTPEQRDAVIRALNERRRKQEEDERSTLDYVIPAALRIGGGVGGALIGGAGTLGLGALAGGGIGSALGETAAQAYEQSQGMREGISPAGIAIEGALGAIPLGKAAGVARAAKQGALLGAGGYAAHKVLEEGEVPGLETVPIAGLGAVLGAGAHKVFSRLPGAVGAAGREAAQTAEERPLVDESFLGLGATEPPPPRTMADLLSPEPAALREQPMRQGFPVFDEAMPSPPPVAPSPEPTFGAAGYPDQIIPDEAFTRLGREMPPPPARPDDAYLRLGQPEGEGALPGTIEPPPPIGPERQLYPASLGKSPVIDRPGLTTDYPPLPQEGFTGLSEQNKLLQAGREAEEALAAREAAQNAPRVENWATPQPTPAPAPAVAPKAAQAAAAPRGKGFESETGFDLIRGKKYLGTFATREAAEAERQRLMAEVASSGVPPHPSDKIRISKAGPKVIGEAPATESALLKFLGRETRGRGATLDALKKKFGPAIEPVLERLTQAGKLDWGGKVGAERFTVVRGSATGAANLELQQMLGGAALGGATGATQGETPEERLTYGLLGAGAGMAGGAALGRLLAQRRLGPNPSRVAEALAGPAPATVEAGPLPSAAKIPTDKRFPVIGGARLTARQGEVPIVQEATRRVGPLPPTAAQPVERFEAAGINLDKYDPALHPFIKESVIDDTQKALVEAQRRGRLPVAWARARANDLISRVDKPLKAGTTLKPEEAYATALHEGAAFQKAHEAAKRATQTGNAVDQAEALDWLLKARVLSLNRTGASAEAARLLRYMQEFRNAMSVSERLVYEAQKQGRLTKAMSEFGDFWRMVPEDPAEAAAFLSKHMDSGAFDKLTSYYMSNILSAVPAFVRNGLGSALNSVGRVAIKAALGGPADILRSKLTGAPRALYSTEVLHEIAAMNYAVQQGIADAFDTFRRGFSVEAIKEGVEFGELMIPKQEFAGGLGNPWNYPGRILEATDRFFQQFNKSMATHGLSFAKASREADAKGLIGQAYDDFVTQRTSELLTSEMVRGEALKTGRYVAFREDPGKIANTIIGLKKQAPILNFIVPFVKTVSNIFRQGIEHSPIAPILSESRRKMLGTGMAQMQGDELFLAQREQSEALAKWAFGLASTVPIAGYAATGKLSGSGPSDPAKRAALYEQGWRPNSVQIGDKWYSYTTWQPLSIPLSLIANAFEAYEDSVDGYTEKGKDIDWENVVASTSFKVLNSATQQSYLQGVMALSAAMEDPDQFASNFLRQMAQGFYPLSGLQRTLARGVDPTIRESKTVQEALQRITPGGSTTLPSRLNRWGQDVQYSGGPLWRMVGGPVFGGEGLKRDPVNDELQRLGLRVGLPSGRLQIGGQVVDLPREQGHEFRSLKGQNLRWMLEQVILSPDYPELPDALKRERVEDTIRRASSRTSRDVRVGYQETPSDLLSLLRNRVQRREQ